MNFKSQNYQSILGGGLCWFLFFLPLNEVGMLLGLVAAWGAYGYALKKKQLAVTPLNLSVYLFGALGICSLIVAAFSPLPKTSLLFALHLFLTAFLGFMFFQGQDFSGPMMDKFLLAFLLGVTCLTFYELTRHLIEKGINFHEHRLGYYAYLSLFLSVSLPLLLAQILKGGGRFNWLAPLWFVFILICFVLTFGRGAWLGAIAGMSYVTINHSKKTAGIFFTCLIIGIILIFPFIRQKARDLIRPNTRSNAQRILGWRTALRMVKSYPLTGVGFANFKQRYWSDEFRPKRAKAKLAHAHNIFLQIYAEQGVIVGTLFFTLVFHLLGQGFLLSRKLTGSQKIRITGVSGALLSLIIGGQFAGSMLINLRIWLLFCFLGAVLTSRSIDFA